MKAFQIKLGFRSLIYRKKQYISLFLICLFGTGISLFSLFYFRVLLLEQGLLLPIRCVHQVVYELLLVRLCLINPMLDSGENVVIQHIITD